MLGIALGSSAAQIRCRCGAEVTLHEARPVIGADGTVSTRCARCAEATSQSGSPGASSHDDPILALETIEPGRAGRQSSGQRSNWLRYASACALAASVVLATRLTAYEPGPAVAALAHVAPDEVADPFSEDLGDPAYAEGELDDLGLGVETGRDESVDDTAIEPVIEPPGPTIEDLLEASGGRLEETFPSLADWVFPVKGSSESFPLRTSRRFGAKRDGVRRTECYQGHCGVDLGGDRGTPIVAVALGRVSRIQRDEDRASGMYVRIEHPDLAYTYYMHLDSIADDLRVGEEVEPGRVLGTLGSTGVLFSAPHLHFSLEIPDIQSESDRLLYIDPAPYLMQSLGLDSPL